MSFPKQAELEALAKKVPEGLNQEELEKLGKLTSDKTKWIADQAAIVLNIANLIKKDKVSLIDLVKNEGFSKKDLEQASIYFKLIVNDTKEVSDSSGETNTGTTRTQKTGPIVFTFEKVGGFRFSQVRQDSITPATPNESHIAFFLKPGKTKEKLLQLKEKGSENEMFLKSPEGNKLVNEWVNWFDTKVKSYIDKHPDKVPAKA